VLKELLKAKRNRIKQLWAANSGESTHMDALLWSKINPLANPALCIFDDSMNDIIDALTDFRDHEAPIGSVEDLIKLQLINGLTSVQIVGFFHSLKTAADQVMIENIHDGVAGNEVIAMHKKIDDLLAMVPPIAEKWVEALACIKTKDAGRLQVRNLKVQCSRPAIGKGGNR